MRFTHCRRCGDSFSVTRRSNLRRRFCAKCDADLGIDEFCGRCMRRVPAAEYCGHNGACRVCVNASSKRFKTPRLERPPCERCGNARSLVARRVCSACGDHLRNAELRWCPVGKHDVPRADMMARRGLAAICRYCHADAVSNGVITGGCEVCGAAMDEHPRCRGCGILIGRGHIHERTYHGRCSSCARAVLRFGRPQVVELSEEELAEVAREGGE